MGVTVVLGDGTTIMIMSHNISNRVREMGTTDGWMRVVIMGRIMDDKRLMVDKVLDGC